MGILTESPGLYERLSARHNLEIFAELYGCKDVRGQVDKYLRLLGCGIAARRRLAPSPRA